jgi:hypothetical protein
MGARVNVFYVMGFAALLSTGCMLDRSATGMCAPGPCGDAGIMHDAWIGDGDVHDAGHDAGSDAFMMLTDAGDANLPDAFMPPIDGGSDAGSDSGSDGGSDAGSDGGRDAGPSGPLLRIRHAYTGSTTVAGFVFAVDWNPGPMTSDWYRTACDPSHVVDTGSAILCDTYAPELMATRTVDVYAVDSSGTSVCSATTCPSGGAITDWSFTYGTNPVSSASFHFMTGAVFPESAIPGNPAYIRISPLPTP